MIRLYDTMSGRNLAIKQPRGRKLKLFVCGPTVYDNAHLGHARTYLVFDSLVRYWRAGGLKVFYLQNITDIDDKIIAKAAELKKEPLKLAHQFEAEYRRDMKDLKVTSVDKYARASAHIGEIKKQIKTLIKKKYAYQTDRGVYFEVKKFKNYGHLSRQNLDDLRSGWRIEPDPRKKDPLDFALWKKESDGKSPSFPSPWGPGRPGWHIEDTAISEKYFGPQYDLHGAAIDLKFPHHECEIAQQEAASGKRPFVKHWIHAGFLLINSEKMSKSLKNFITIKDFLKKYPANVLRLLVLGHHYRSPVNYTDKLVGDYRGALSKINKFIHTISLSEKNFQSIDKKFNQALADDFNTPRALAEIFLFIAAAPKTEEAKKYLIKKLAILGIVLPLPKIPAAIKKLIAKREKLRQSKDFKAADQLRSRIEKAGFVVED